MTFKLFYLFTLVVFLRPHELFPILQGAHLADIFGVATLTTFCLQNFHDLPSILRERESKILIAILACIVITLPFGLWPGGSFKVLTEKVIVVYIAYFLIIGIVTSPERITRIIWLITICVGIYAVLGLHDYMRGSYLLQGRLMGRGWTYANPNDLALALCIPLPLMLFLIQINKLGVRKIVLCGLTAATLATVIFTYSRTGILALTFVCLGFVIKSQRKARSIFISMIIIVIILGMGSHQYIDRAASIFDPSRDYSGSRQHRITIMKTGVRTFFSRPILGIGLGNFTIAEGLSHGKIGHWKSAHNGYLEVAVELGIFGLLLFLSLLYSIAKNLRRIQRAISRENELTNIIRLSTSLEIMLWIYMVTLFFGASPYAWSFIYLLGFSVAIRRWLLRVQYTKEAKTTLETG